MTEDPRPKYSIKLVKINWLLLLVSILSIYLGFIFNHSFLTIKAIWVAITFGFVFIIGVLLIIFLGVAEHRIKWWRLLAVPVFILALPGFFMLSYTPLNNIVTQIGGKLLANSGITIFLYFAISIFMWWWVPGKTLNKWLLMSIGEIPGDFDKTDDSKS